MSNRSVLAVLVVMAAVVGCNDNKKPQGQVVAVVGKDEITANQIALATRNANGRLTSDKALDQLIERQLTAKAALAAGMDRQPDILLRLEEAKLDVLAAAYGESLTRTLASPKDEDVARFYSEHPGLFKERKQYRLKEVAIPADTELIKEINKRLSEDEPLNTLLAWLKQGGKPFSERGVAMPTDQLPIELSDKFAKAKQGDVIALKRPDGFLIFEIQAEQAAPVAWREAAPGIKAHLIKLKSGELMKEEIQRLRGLTKVEKATPTTTEGSKG